MKIRVYVLDFGWSPRTRKIVRRTAAVAAVVGVFAAGLAIAGVPNTFNAGDLLSAQKINDDFASLDSRLTTLEAAKADGGTTSGSEWQLLQSATLTSSADYTFSGLNGDAYSRFRVEIEGTFFVGGADRAIGLRPNNDTTNLAYVSVPGYDWHVPNSSIGTGSAYWGVAANSNWNQALVCDSAAATDSQIFCTTEMTTKSGTIRLFDGHSTRVTINSTCGAAGVGCIGHDRWGAAWRNTTANITSLTIFFNNATGFNGTVRLYART